VAVDKRYDIAKRVYLDPVDDLGDVHVATSASLTVYDSSGTSYQTPAVTLPTAATTIASASANKLELNLTSTAGFGTNERVRVVCDGVTYAPRVARISGGIAYLDTALPVTPQAGDPVSAIRLSATIAAGVEDDIGLDYRLEWQWASATDAGHSVELLDIVRWPWTCPITADTVREHLATVFAVADRSDVWCQHVADRVSDMLQQDVRRAGRREHLLASADVFRELGNLAQTMILAELGYAKGDDSVEAMRAARYAYEDRLERVLGGLTYYDADNDGAVDDGEATAWMTFVTRR